MTPNDALLALLADLRMQIAAQAERIAHLEAQIESQVDN